MSIEKEIQKFNQLKMDLLKISKCIECCEDQKDEEFYQNIALEYSKEIKNRKKAMEEEYQINFCNCCRVD